MPAECTFCQIVNGSRDAAIVYRSDDIVAFLDHRPLFPGHVLVVPAEHTETLEDLPHERFGDVFSFVARMSRAVREAVAAEGTFVAMNNRVSQSVPHLHVHVVPRTKGDGLRGFFWPRHPYEDDTHRDDVAESIRRKLALG